MGKEIKKKGGLMDNGKFLFFMTILFELAGNYFLNYTNGYTVLWASLLCLGLYFLSFFFFAKALQKIFLGIAYALWSGVGIVFLAIVSVLVFHQSLNRNDLIGMVVIIIGVVLMNMFGANETTDDAKAKVEAEKERKAREKAGLETAKVQSGDDSTNSENE